MAKNDKILLDGIIDDRVSKRIPSNQRDEAFEYLAFEQVLKDYDLSRDELESGIVDGGQDGGIDGLYLFVNGNLLQDTKGFLWPKTSTEISLYIFTCKHHDTFKQSTIDAIIASLTEILDFQIKDADIQGIYSPPLIKFRELLMQAYRRLSPTLSNFSISIIYASRGDSSAVGSEVSARASQISALVGSFFGNCSSQFSFIGSAELIALHRRVNSYSLELPCTEVMSSGERYVLLCKLEDYYRFISNDGKLRRYLFDSNVRDFMGLNRVNEDIKKSLEDESSQDFWVLNNGVTILATSASLVGKSIHIKDIQIVNGLQTSESIFRFFSSGHADTSNRSVLVKVIVTREEAVRDAVIRATNNQTSIELTSLHATDKIQRDIEDILHRSGIYYERRKNYYANLGHDQNDIVTPQYLASGYIGLVLKSPSTASKRSQKYMRSDHVYGKIFSESIPIRVWPVIAKTLKRVDAQLERYRPKGIGANRFLKRWRYLTALLIIAKCSGKFSFGAEELSNFDPNGVNEGSVDEVMAHIRSCATMDGEARKSTVGPLVKTVCESFGRLHGIPDAPAIVGRLDSFFSQSRSLSKEMLTPEFIEKVASALPPQPWKVGMHHGLIKYLGCSPNHYKSAVQLLIQQGRIFEQKDGILYDTKGDIVGFDVERVDPQTLSILKR